MFLSKRICLLRFTFGIFLSFPCFRISLFPSLMNAPFDGRSPARAVPVHRQVCVQPGCAVDSLKLAKQLLSAGLELPSPSSRDGITVDAWEEKGDLYPWLPPSCPHCRPLHVSQHGCVSPMCCAAFAALTQLLVDAVRAPLPGNPFWAFFKMEMLSWMAPQGWGGE